MKKAKIYLLCLFSTTFYVSDAQFWQTTGNFLTGFETFGSTNNQPINFVTNNIPRMRLENGTGFLGIGVAAPNDILHIHDGNNSVLHVTNGGTGVGSPTLGVKFGLFNNTIHALIAQQSANPQARILFTTNGLPSFANTKMTIMNNGNVGIGTGFITPNNKLDVNGGDIDVDTPQRSYMIADSSVLWHKGSNENIFVGVKV